ncbi:MAG: hypothetical protein ACLRRT_10985 [Ruthenibacterium lactatiformans]
MRFLMLFLRLVLCAVCLFALCPSVPQADGSDTPDSLPLLAQERIQERDSCLLAAPAPLSARPRVARHAAAARSVCGSRRGRRRLWRCLVHCRHACRASPPALPAFSTARRPCAAFP